MKIVFICNQGILRSSTAKELWNKLHPEDEAIFIGYMDEFNK